MSRGQAYALPRSCRGGGEASSHLRHGRLRPESRFQFQLPSFWQIETSFRVQLARHRLRTAPALEWFSRHSSKEAGATFVSVLGVSRMPRVAWPDLDCLVALCSHKNSFAKSAASAVPLTIPPKRAQRTVTTRREPV